MQGARQLREGPVDQQLAALAAPVSCIEGIGPVRAQKLEENAGIATVGDLLAACKTPRQREELEEKTGLGRERILDWTNRADLMRVRGVGEAYSDLLEWAGVDTVPELAQRNPEHLYQKMLEANEERRLVRRPPTLEDVRDWVAQAQKLPRVVQYD